MIGFKSNAGNDNTGHSNTGCKNSGNRNTGDWNAGNGNSGNCNAGDRNTGYWNSGKRNAGDRNVGDRNVGSCNTGDYNVGDHNAGRWNTGNCNAGDLNVGFGNTGDYNVGDWNKSSSNAGCFMTVGSTIMMFDKPSSWAMEDWQNSLACRIMHNCPTKYTDTNWIMAVDMTDKEKKEHPEYKTTGGYLKVVKYEADRQKWWDGLSDSDKQEVMSIPNFDADIFYECTGIKV